MEIVSIEAENFLSFKHVHVNFENQGLILLEGKNNTSNEFTSNGSGKSILVSSITYAIFDKTFKEEKGDSVIHKDEDYMSLILTARKHGSTYRIEKYRKHPTHKNKVLLYRDNQDITHKSRTDTTNAIEELFGMDIKTYANSVMFGQSDNIARFSSATDKGKKEILEDIINLSVYGEAQQVARERVKEQDQKIQENKREQDKQEQAFTYIDQLEEQDRKNYEHTKNLIQQQENNIQENQANRQQYVTSNEQVIEQLEQELETMKQEQIDQPNPELKEAQENFNHFKQRHQQEEWNLNQQKQHVQELLKKYKELEQSETCPMCGSEMNPEHRKQEMTTLYNKLQEQLPMVKKLEDKLSESSHYIGLQQVELQSLEAEEQDRQKKQQTHYQKMNEVQQRIQQYRNQLQSYDDYEKQVQDYLQQLQNVPKPSSRHTERQDTEQRINTLKEEQLALEKRRKTLENVVKVYSNEGVKSHVLDLVTPYLNERANHYIYQLSGGTIEILFSTQKENKNGEKSDKFDIEVKNASGGTTYQSNSTGEKRRIDLAISLAIQDLCMSKADMKTNVVVYDEVFDGLDSVGAENVVNVLKEKVKEIPTILVITHSEDLKAYFDTVWTVEKSSNYSELRT